MPEPTRAAIVAAERERWQDEARAYVQTMAELMEPAPSGAAIEREVEAVARALCRLAGAGAR